MLLYESWKEGRSGDHLKPKRPFIVPFSGCRFKSTVGCRVQNEADTGLAQEDQKRLAALRPLQSQHVNSEASVQRENDVRVAEVTLPFIASSTKMGAKAQEARRPK